MKTITFILLLFASFARANCHNLDSISQPKFDSLLSIVNKLQGKELSLQGEIVLLSLDKSALAISKSLLENEKTELTNRLSAVDNTLPKSIQPNRVVVHDDKAYIEFSLNTPGFIKLNVYRHGNTSLDQDPIFSSYDVNPVVQIGNLLPNTRYSIEAIVVNYNKVETKLSALPKDFPSLNFTTMPRIDNPFVSQLPHRIDGTTIALPFNTNNERLVISFTCYRIVNVGGRRVRNESVSYNKNVNANKFGIIEEFPLDDGVTIQGLEPETEYDIDMSFYNRFGKFTFLTLNYKTDDRPKLLDFEGGISFDFNVLNSKITWETTKRATRAYIDFEVPDGSTQIIKEAVYLNDSICSVDLNLNDFKSLLNIKTANRIVGLPQINAHIVDEKGNGKTASFRIVFSLPDQNTINRNGGSLSDAQKAAISEAAKEVNSFNTGQTPGNKKIAWDKIAQVGLPIIMSFL
jgi:hypothetical protein